MEEKEFAELKKRMEEMVEHEMEMGTGSSTILRMVLNRMTALEGMPCERTYTESQIAELVGLIYVYIGTPFFKEK